MVTASYFIIPGIKDNRIMKEVLDYFMINYDALVFGSRKYEYVYRRQVLHWICAHMKLKHSFHMTYEEIGQETNQHHATVFHSVRTINNYLTYDKRVQNDIANLTKIIYERYGLR